jgi:hypothetical protein
MIVDLILWVVIAIIVIAWYIEYRNEKKSKVAEDLRIYKTEGVGVLGHLPGKYHAVL